MIRPATLDDIPALRRVYGAAKAYMDAHGNPSQWTNGYPDEQQLVRDIEKSALYAMEEDGQIYAAFALLSGVEPAYLAIDGLGWRSDSDYLTLHRVGSDGTRRGVFAQAVEFAAARCPHLRVDTHRDNQTMQAAILKAGFTYAGTVFYPDVGERLAYDRIAP